MNILSYALLFNNIFWTYETKSWTIKIYKRKRETDSEKSLDFHKLLFVYSYNNFMLLIIVYLKALL